MLTTDQTKCITNLLNWKVGAIFMEAGTGKTRAAMEIVKTSQCDAVVWVAPLRTLSNLEKEINKWGGIGVDVYYYGVESIGMSDRIFMDVHNLLGEYKSPFLIVDESLKIKNKEAKRTQRLLSLSKEAECKLVLNGTPLSKNLLDLWTQMEFLDHLFYYAGVPLHKQRVASPFLSEGMEAIHLYQVIEPDTWGRLIGRVNGVNFAGLYGGTTAMGWQKITKPKHFTWEQYMYFLLDTLPPGIKQNYLDKLSTSVKFWRERGGCLDEETIERLKNAGVKMSVGEDTNYNTTKKPVRMEYQQDYKGKNFKDIPTYKRMCICIIKNDHLCKYMGFSLTKNEMERRAAIKEKYKNL